MLLGDDLLPLLVLAFGGAMAIGSVLALIRPPDEVRQGTSDPAPVGRSLAFAAIGAAAAIWAIASLVS